MKKLFMLATFLGLGQFMNCPYFTGIANADDADMFTITIQPDVMLILDVSGSMTYDMSGDCTWGDGSADYPGLDIDGNGFADDSRLYIAKAAINCVVAKRDMFRWGFETFPYQKHFWHWADWYRAPPNYSNWIQIPWGYSTLAEAYGNGNIHVNIAEGAPAHLQQIYNLIDNVHQIQELRAEGGTPIGGALYLARQELTQEIQTDMSPGGGGTWCRRYFCVLIGDGEETGYPSYNPNSPYAEATALRDIVVDTFHFDIQTYVIGIAISGGSGAQCLDSIAKLGGTYHYYPATSPAALDSVMDIIASDVEQKAFSFAAPEVPAIRTKYYNCIYFASFMPSYTPFWQGFLKAYRLNPDGTFPQDAVTGEPLHSPLWEAGEKLKNKLSSARAIYTAKGGSRVNFTPFNIDSIDLDVPGDSVDPLINYVRGDNGYYWKLGDIFHSWPVCIGPPSPWYFEEGYNQFKVTHAHRSKIIVSGSNDGMLHGFDAGTYVVSGDSFTTGTGEEVWAFIPPNFLPTLKDMKSQHDYYVDGTPIAYDVWFHSGAGDTTQDPSEWKTIVMCGERRGGNHYFALDVTNTQDPEWLWDWTDGDLGQTWSTPVLGKINIGGYERWFAIIGGGFNKEAGTVGRAVYILDVTEGDTLWKFTDPNLTSCVPSAPACIDLSENGCIDRIYIGDLDGQMWKLDISDPDIANWEGYRIFRSLNKDQPFYYPPSCAKDEADNLWLFFGGGDRDSVRDVTLKNRFFGVRDNGQTTPYTESNLKDVTGAGTVNDNGWYLTFVRNEKCLSKSIVFGGIVYFTTYEPLFDDPCIALGKARLYRVVFTTGKAREGEDISEDIGEGLPTAPQFSVTPEGDFVVTIGASRGEIVSEKVDAPGAFKRMLWWREHRY
ncbi:hypothetical protein KAW50_01835 [candidate division WOR-3 bacterium]|nr:hypothetical protein [candidate division WOR-3 bacterium]